MQIPYSNCNTCNMADPRIGVLIPAHNEELVLTGTIQALIAADCEPRDIYVIDDRSTDTTAAVAKRCGVNIRTTPVNVGKATAQRAAMSTWTSWNLLQRYDWLIFLDGDTKVDLYFFNAMFKAAKEDPSVALYVGQVRSVENNHIYSAARAFDYTFGQDIAKHGQSNFGTVYVSPGCASMYRTDVLAKLHIDHKTLAEDMDLTIQVHRIGEHVVYLPLAIVNTQDPNNIVDYHKQMLRWYRGMWQVVRKHNVFGLTLRKQRVDLYMMLIIIDAMVLSRPFWLLAMLFIAPHVIPWLIASDIAVSLGIALYAGFRTKRKDVVLKLPIYYWLSYFNFYVFFRSFVEIIILRKEILAWNKVKRYDFGPK